MTALQNNIWDNKHLQSLVGGFNLRNSSQIRQKRSEIKNDWNHHLFQIPYITHTFRAMLNNPLQSPI